MDDHPVLTLIGKVSLCVGVGSTSILIPVKAAQGAVVGASLFLGFESFFTIGYPRRAVQLLAGTAIAAGGTSLDFAYQWGGEISMLSWMGGMGVTHLIDRVWSYCRLEIPPPIHVEENPLVAVALRERRQGTYVNLDREAAG